MSRAHKRRRVVLTGGPGAGKTATLELIRQSFCEHVHVLPEAALEATPDFLAKAARALEALREELPECCRRHVVPVLDQHLRSATE